MNTFTKLLSALATFILIGAVAPFAFAGDYEISWYTIDSGGGTSTGGAYSLTGTIGQCDAGDMAGGRYTIAGGYWSTGTTPVPPSCPGDFNSSGSVGVDDLLALLAVWGPCSGCQTDLNGNGSTDVADLLVLLGSWGPCP